MRDYFGNVAASRIGAGDLELPCTSGVLIARGVHRGVCTGIRWDPLGSAWEGWRLARNWRALRPSV
jgi:hypothetical protein